MSVARGFGINGKSYFTNICKPIDVNMQFVVTPTNGLGVTSFKSNGFVNNVFMHTSTTPASNNGYLNPNPANGYAMVQFKQNFNYLVGGFQGMISANSGSDVKIDNSAMVAGQVYTITTLGNATLAKWVTIGVPVGVTPAVGVSFVAASNGGTGNTLTSRVQVPAVSGISSMEIVGNPNVMYNSSIAANAGQFVFVQFLAPIIAVTAGTAGDAVTNNAGVLNSTGGQDVPVTAVATAPLAGSTVNLYFRFDGSSVTVDGL